MSRTLLALNDGLNEVFALQEPHFITADCKLERPSIPKDEIDDLFARFVYLVNSRFKIAVGRDQRRYIELVTVRPEREI